MTPDHCGSLSQTSLPVFRYRFIGRENEAYGVLQRHPLIYSIFSRFRD